ncbi:hypothetical protein A2U01_0065841, partial [Trifolium medium]|nr:hypothetical protein [Trifolium medium]
IQEPMMGASNGKTNVEFTHEHALSQEVHVLKARHDPMDYAHSDDVPFLRVVLVPKPPRRNNNSQLELSRPE